MLEPLEKEFINGIEEEVKNSKIGLLGFAIIFLVVFSFIFSWVFALSIGSPIPIIIWFAIAILLAACGGE